MSKKLYPQIFNHKSVLFIFSCDIQSKIVSSSTQLFFDKEFLIMFLDCQNSNIIIRT